MARPKLNIDVKVLESLAKLGATNVEIADHFGCAEATIRGRFCDILTKARAGRKIKLRELQWRQAEKGNLGMLIWLGKQELGQAETQPQINALLQQNNIQIGAITIDAVKAAIAADKFTQQQLLEHVRSIDGSDGGIIRSEDSGVRRDAIQEQQPGRLEDDCSLRDPFSEGSFRPSESDSSGSADDDSGSRGARCAEAEAPGVDESGSEDRGGA